MKVPRTTVYIFPTHTRRGDGRYGPTSRGQFYNPPLYHGRSGRQSSRKSRWRIREGEQFHVFNLADTGQWISQDTYLALLADATVILGLEEERMAVFRFPSQGSLDWHGHPITGIRPTIDLLNKWEAAGLISESTRRRLEGGRL